MRSIIQLLLFGFLAFSGAQAQSAAIPASGVEWKTFQEALAQAKSTSSKILIDVYAPWCGWCTRLQEEVYTDEKVQAYLKKHFTVARLNIDAIDDKLSYKGYELSSAELAVGLGASGTPTTVFMDRNGEYVTRLPGFLGANEFLTVLEYIGSDAYRSQSFEEFAGLN